MRPHKENTIICKVCLNPVVYVYSLPWILDTMGDFMRKAESYGTCTGVCVCISLCIIYCIL